MSTTQISGDSMEQGLTNYRAESEQIREIDMEVDSSIKGYSNEYDTALVNFSGPVVSPEDERRLKRERRKQANRESARKSRMRKQTEYEDLTQSWESLKMENSALKSELEKLYSDSEKLRRENSVLMEKLEGSEVQKGEMVSRNIGADVASTNNIEKVSDDSNNLRTNLNLVQNETDKSKNSQLLGSNPVSDTVAAR